MGEQTQTAIVQSLQIGRVQFMGDSGVTSAIAKQPVSGPVRVGTLSLEGDAQADLTVHGGPDKAVYGYASAHYPEWVLDFPHHAALLVPGIFGENLTISGMTEAEMCVGDVHAIGTARLQVCQPRQPCFKLALRFEDEQVPRQMIRNGRAGWYYRVIEEGVIAAGDSIALVHRPNPSFPFQRLVEIVYTRRATDAEWRMIATMPGIATWLRERGERHINKAG